MDHPVPVIPTNPRIVSLPSVRSWISRRLLLTSFAFTGFCSAPHALATTLLWSSEYLRYSGATGAYTSPYIGSGEWLGANWFEISNNYNGPTGWENFAKAVFGDDAYEGQGSTNAGTIHVEGRQVVDVMTIYATKGEFWFKDGILDFRDPAANSPARGVFLHTFNKQVDRPVEPRIDSEIRGTIVLKKLTSIHERGSLELGGNTNNTSLNLTASLGAGVRLNKDASVVAVNNLTIEPTAYVQIPAQAANQIIGGELTLGAGTTFDTGNGHAVSMGSLKGTGQFVDASGTVGPLEIGAGDFSGVASFCAGLRKMSGGNLRLAGANTFASVEINGGTLTLANASAIAGTNPVLFVSGTIRAEVPMTLNRAMAVNGSQAVGLDTPAALTLTGAVTAIACVVVKSGAASLTLSGSTDNAGLILNAAAGETYLAKSSSAGVHAVAGISDIVPGATVWLYGGSGGDQIYDGNSTGPNSLVNMTGGTLELAGSSEGWDRLTGTGSVQNTIAGTSIVTLGTASGSSSYAGQLAEANAAKLALVKTGSGVLTLSGASSFTGGTTINGGAVFVQNSAALGTGLLTLNSGEVRLESSLNLSAGLSGPSSTEIFASYNTGHVLTIVPASAFFGGKFIAQTNVNIAAGAPGSFQVFSGSSSHSGTTTVSGYLSISSADALGGVAGVTTVNGGGTLELWAAGGPAALTYLAEPLTLNDGAIFQVNTSGALRHGTFPGPVTLPNAATSRLRVEGGNAGSLSLTGAMSGAGNVRIEGVSGPILFDGLSKTHTGLTTIGTGTLMARTGITGIVALGDAATGSDATRLLLDGLADFNAPIVVAAVGGPALIEAVNIPPVLSVNGPVTLLRATTFQLSQSNAVRRTFNGKISGNVGTLTIQGRTVLDSPLNDFTGDIVVNAGTLLQAGLGQSETIPDTAAVTLNAGSRLAITGPANETIRALRGSGGVVDTLYAYAQTLGIALPPGTETFGGVLQNGGGPLAITKTGAGRQILTGLNTYTGETLVNGGTLEVSGGGSLYSGGTVAGSITVGNGGTFSFGRTDTFGAHTSNSPVSIVVNAGGLLTNGSFFNTLQNVTLNGGELRVTGGASATFQAFQLKGTVTAGGTVLSQITAVNAALPEQAIQLGDNTATGTTTFAMADTAPGVELRVTAVLANGRSAAGALVASGLIKTGTGTMELLAANTFTGLTTINAGTLAVKGSIAGGATLGSGGTLSGTGTVNGGLTVNAGGTVAQTSGTLTVNGAITNSGTIRFTGGAALNASGATSFVNNGVVDIINGSAQFPANFSNGANGLVLTPGSVKVKSAAKNGNAVSVHIDSYSGHTFRLERTNSLTQAFTDIGTAQLGVTGSTLIFTDNNASNAQGFYRVAVD